MANIGRGLARGAGALVVAAVVGPMVATAVASTVGRDRSLAIVAGLQAGTTTALSSWIAAETGSRPVPAG